LGNPANVPFPDDQALLRAGPQELYFLVLKSRPINYVQISSDLVRIQTARRHRNTKDFIDAPNLIRGGRLQSDRRISAIRCRYPLPFTEISITHGAGHPALRYRLAEMTKPEGVDRLQFRSYAIVLPREETGTWLGTETLSKVAL